MKLHSAITAFLHFNLAVCSLILFTGPNTFARDENLSDGSGRHYDAPNYSALHEKYFYSAYVKDTIKLDISLPFNYNNEATKKYNVVYLTDGYWRKGEHDTIHEMSRNGKIKEVILVGIGYPDYYNFNVIRTRDLITNADKLLLCIKQEIIPYIETAYRADTTDRTLWGSSYGGYFLMYAFTEHEKNGRLFKNYIQASAALNPPYAHTDLLQNEQALWTNATVLPVNLYMAVGGDETAFFLDSYRSLVNAITSHPYRGLRFEYEIIQKTNHYTVWKPALLNGLKKFLAAQ